MEDELTAMYPRHLLSRTNYSETNTAFFTTNKSVVSKGIKNLLETLHTQHRIAAGKAVAIGHSMGGILSRLYLQDDAYKGDIQKLITINTPHSGSQVADMVYDPWLPLTLTNLLRFGAMYVDNGAMSDLRVEGDAIRKLLNGPSKTRNLVPSHVIVTDKSWDYNNLALSYQFILHSTEEAIFSQIGNTPASLFGEEKHDWIVPRQSQLGGMVGCVSEINNQWHMGSTDNLTVITMVRLLLISDPLGNKFCRTGFNPPLLTYHSPFFLPLLSQGTTLPPLVITSPERGVFPYNLQYFNVNVSGTNLSEITSYVSYNRDSVYIGQVQGNKANFQFSNYTVPSKREVVTIGKTITGEKISVSVTDTFCETMKSGNWDDVAVWKDGRVPTASDVVILNSNHLISIRTSARVKSLLLKGGNYEIKAQGSLKIDAN